MKRILSRHGRRVVIRCRFRCFSPDGLRGVGQLAENRLVAASSHRAHLWPWGQVRMAMWVLSLLTVGPAVILSRDASRSWWIAAAGSATAAATCLTLALGWSLGARGTWRSIPRTALLGAVPVSFELTVAAYATIPPGTPTTPFDGGAFYVLTVLAFATLSLVLGASAGPAALLYRLRHGRRPFIPPRPDRPLIPWWRRIM